MARTRRRRGGVPTAVKRTVRRVRTTARRRAPAGGDLMKAVQSLVKALPVSELEKRLAGLEKTVARLGAGLRVAPAPLCGASAPPSARPQSGRRQSGLPSAPLRSAAPAVGLQRRPRSAGHGGAP